MWHYRENSSKSLYDETIRGKTPYKSHQHRDNKFRVIKTPLPPRRCPPVIRDKDVENPPRYSSSWSAFLAEKALATLKEIIKQRTEREEFVNGKGVEENFDAIDQINNNENIDERKPHEREFKEALRKTVDNIPYEPEKREMEEVIEQIIYSGDEREIKKAIETVAYANEEQALEEAIRQVDGRETSPYLEKNSNETLEGGSLEEHEIEGPEDPNKREENNPTEEIGNPDMDLQDSRDLTPPEQNLESIMENEPGITSLPEDVNDGGEFEQSFPEEPPEMAEPGGI